MKLLGILLQVFAMLTDLLLLAVLVICGWEWGLLGVAVAFLLIWGPTKETGGFFFAWKPANIKHFFRNWNAYTRNEP